MAPLRGWGPSGQRLEASAPFGHWKTMTFIAALRYDRISAPWVIDGPISGELFTLYVEKVLAPTLAKGEVVILDNLGSHKTGPQRHPRQGSSPALPAAQQPRSQSDRAGLRQNQTPDPSRRATRRRGNLAKGRRTPRSLLQRGVRQLFQKLRVCFRIKASRS
jgi:DDE superfamily endonuclease